MAYTYEVIHYLNQFFGQFGGEEKAQMGAQVQPGPIGPGKQLQNLLGGRGNVVATVICGDNFFTENTSAALDKIFELVSPYRFHAMIAGPERSYLWILCRDRNLDKSVLSDLVSKASGWGFETDKLIYVKHDREG